MALVKNKRNELSVLNEYGKDILNSISTNVIYSAYKTKKYISNKLEEKKMEMIEKSAYYAIDKFGHSEYARENVNLIPIMITSILIKNLIIFLLYNRLQTGNRINDLFISILITLVCSGLSPVIYEACTKQAPFYMMYTNNFMNNLFSTGGIDYFIQWKNKILFTGTLFMICLLHLIEITSEFLIDTLICSLVTGVICNTVQFYTIPKQNSIVIKNQNQNQINIQNNISIKDSVIILDNNKNIDQKTKRVGSFCIIEEYD